MTAVDQTAVLEIVSPVDGRPVGSVPVSSRDEISAAFTFAHRAQPVWARTPAGERGSMLRNAAVRLRAHADELADLNRSETGKPREEAREGALAGAATLEQYAELGPVHRGRSLLGDFAATDLMVPEPRGVVVALTPWNDPVAVACGLLGAAVVTGNTVVYKPSERCPRTGGLLGEVLAGTFPDGVLQTLHGDGRVGAALAARDDFDLIAHVGSTATGRSIAASAAATGAKVLLENGGNDPLVVDEGVDPRWAAEQAALGSFANAGQICVAVERIYVHQAVAEPFIEALVEQARSHDTPPLVDTRHRSDVHSQVEDAVSRGATARTGGEIPSGPGAHYPATVLTGCAKGMRVLHEETFGPVAPVRVVDTFEQGLAEAADDEYGLAATVLTPSMTHAQHAWRELAVGTVKINAVFGGAPGGAAHPRRRSGTGYGYGPELLDEMTQTKLVHLSPPGPA
ncbi:aldehyde dehydrogenase family protein [Amycolatopsis jiangsuensis]|uniref:Acyl-CoA reductase-like NAD-dependent aldehyde dehydrogenase n=1 Tax=Amycolatopsis jiangsuensis TaxID=1181879 RepID=A0A840J2B4_9PSEU|nr:aldehyde dehydrogenase family protein [Amycolatopsis jiangsuensis]MBB4689156.1 acyl-CoA reductase-like NAD-dependent aldehyde dehydrogenase [Amycolatopsis jiangsuensis]